MTSAGYGLLGKFGRMARLMAGALLVALALTFVAGPAGASPCAACDDGGGGGGGETIAPTVTGVSPAENATNVPRSQNVTATFSESMESTTITTSTFTLVRQGTSTPVAATVSYDSASKTATLNPNADLDSLATYTATVTSGAKDLAGNGLDQDSATAGEQPKTWSFTVADYTDPIVSLTSPTGPYATGIISIQANASDNDRVSRVEFYVGGMKVGEDTTAPYSTSFNTVGYDGSALFRAVAVDASGRSAEANRMVTIDNTNPVLNFTSGPNGQTFGPDTTQTWTFSASDAASGVQSVHCKVERNGSQAAYGACSGGSTSHSVSNLPDGQYNFYVRVTDNVGRSIVGSRFFSIDATAPQTTITSGVAEGAATNQTTLTWNFSSSEGGSTFECRVYPAALTEPAFGTCSGTGSHTASGFSPGTYTFEVRATDAVGNVDSTPDKRTFTVDTARPTGSVVINNNRAITTSLAVRLTLRARDTGGSGMSSMRIANSLSTLSKAAWQPYVSSKKWRLLGGGSGTRKVYVQYRDGAGNVSVVVLDRIRYRR